MLQAEWKRVVNEIEKAIQKIIASEKEYRDRSLNGSNALIATPLNNLAEQLERYQLQQQANDERRVRREIATLRAIAVTALLTFLTAVIFYFQLNQTRIGIRHADEAARTQHSDTIAFIQSANDDATKQRDISVDTEQRQLRAYVMIQSEMELAISDTNIIAVLLKVKNFGLTPAFKVKHWTCLATRDFVIKDASIIEPTDLPDWDDTKLGAGVVPPGDNFNVTDVHFCDGQKLIAPVLSPEDHKAIIGNTKALYLYGAITYEDAFGKPHFTKFRLFATGKFGLSQGTFDMANNGNDAH
jgi:hypothetical protein